RGKEPEALDVIHVQMGQQHAHTLNRRIDGVPEAPDARPRVERKDRAVRAPDFHGSRISAIADGVGARACERPASPPKLDDHCADGCQNIASPPRSWPRGPSSGNAVTTSLREMPSRPRMRSGPWTGC